MINFLDNQFLAAISAEGTITFSQSRRRIKVEVNIFVYSFVRSTTNFLEGKLLKLNLVDNQFSAEE